MLLPADVWQGGTLREGGILQRIRSCLDTSKAISQKLAGPNNKGATSGPCTLQHFLARVRALSNGVTCVWCAACGVPHTDRGCIRHQLLEVSLPQAQSIVHSVWMFALSCIGICVLSFYAVYSCTSYPAHCAFLPFAFTLALCSLTGELCSFPGP